MNARMRRLRVACVHLFDDYTGSAKIFAHAISEIEAAGCQVRVTIGSAGTAGFIRDAHSTESVFYRFGKNKIGQMFFLALAQLLLFLRVLRLCVVWRADVVYANTVLTPAAVLAGRLCGRRVVTHLQEVGLGSPLLFRLFSGIPRHLSHRLICVSEYVRQTLRIPPDRAMVVHNALAPIEWDKAYAYAEKRSGGHPNGNFLVVMACSLKWYKGIDSFLAIAATLESSINFSTRFRLLLNCTEGEWREFSSGMHIAGNVEVVIRPRDVYAHYCDAGLVMNLSHAEACVESFGMTLLEGMACGVPVIAPRVGGCVELFADGDGGWHLDSRDISGIGARITALESDESLWRAASAAARANAARFSPEAFAAGICNAVLPDARAR